jgi:hypothetical protein
VSARRLWVGSARNVAAFELIRCVRRVWGDGVSVVAAEALPANQCTASLLADEYVEMPAVHDAGFNQALLQGLEQYGITAYMTTTDPEVVAVAKLREAGRWPRTVRIHMTEEPSASLVFDKLLLARWLAMRALPTPRTELPRELPWDDRGVVLKPRRGFGSRDVQVFRDRDAFEHALAGKWFDLAAQYRCEPPEVTLDAFRARDGRLRAVARERLAVLSGVAIRARVHEDPELEQLTATVAEALQLQGAFCLQVMRSAAHGGWSIIDVNPRLGGGTAMSAAAGVDVMAAALAALFDEDPWPHLRPLDGERFVSRQFEAHVHPV